MLTPMTYDAAATKARILAAATSEFAEHGVAGARIDRIAASAQANKRAIYDYFGDKARLFTVVLETALTRLVEDVPLDGPDGVDPADYATRLFDYHETHPEIVRLLLWEGLTYGTGPIPGEQWRAEHYARKTAHFARAQQDGTVRDDLPPQVLILMLLGLSNWLFAAPQLRRMLLGEDTARDDVRESLATVARDLLAPRT